MRSARSGSTGRVSTPTTRSTSASSGQAAREPRAERVRHAGDQDAPAGHASAALRWRTPAAGWPAALGRRALGRRGAPARGGPGGLELLDASLERVDALAQGGDLVGARGAQVLERLAEAPGGGHQLVGELLRALAREAGLAGRRLDGLRRGRPHGVAAALLLRVRRGVLLLLAGVLLGQGPTSLSSPAVAHLHPTAELAERALLPDDPGQALALTRVLYGETPRMFNHHRGLWGYTGIALDGAPLTVQSTGIGGPSAAIVVAELQAPGPAPRGAHRAGVGPRRRGCAPASSWRPARWSRATGRAGPWAPASASSPTRRSPRRWTATAAACSPPPTSSALDDASGALAFDLESAAVLAAAARAGIPAACLVAIEGAVDPDDVAARLGRAALAAIAPVRAELVGGRRALAGVRLAATRLTAACLGADVRSSTSSLVTRRARPEARRAARRGDRRRPRCPPGAARPTARAA